MWASLIFSLIKSAPAIYKLYNDVSSLVDSWILAKIENESSEVGKERDALIDQFNRESSKEARREIRRKLYELHNKT